MFSSSVSNARASKAAWKQLACRLQPFLYSASYRAHYATSQTIAIPDEDSNKNNLSRFFDKHTFIDPVSTGSGDPPNKPSYEIISLSKKAVASFRSDVTSRNNTRIIAGYAALLKAFEQHKASLHASSSRPIKLDHSFPLRKNDIQTAIRFLIQNAKKKGFMDRASLKAAQLMFHHLVDQFNLSHGPTDLHYHVQIFCMQDTEHGIKHDPMKIFQDLRTANPNWRTSSVEWNMVAIFLSKTRQYKRACDLFEDMKQHGTEPETEYLITMMKLHFRFDQTERVESILLSIEKRNGTLSVEVLTAVVEGYCDLFQAVFQQRVEVGSRLQSYAEQLQSKLKQLDQASVPLEAWHAMLRYESLVFGQTYALEKAKESGPSGRLDSKTLTRLLRLQTENLESIQTSDEAMSLLEKIIDVDPLRQVKPNGEAYFILMSALLGNVPRSKRILQEQTVARPAETRSMERDIVPTPNQIREAQMLYDFLRSTGVRFAPKVVAPLLNSYCEAFLPSLSSAMKLIKDLFQDARSRQTSNEPPYGITMNIISPVFNACVKLRDLSVVNDLIARMRKAGMTLEAKEKLQLARLLMPLATTWREAFSFYQSIWRLPLTDHARFGFDESGYTILLDVFRKLPCTDDHFSGSASQGTACAAPPEYMLCIVEDMRQAGYQPSCVVYTTILDYYSKLSTPSYEGVQATHELLKSDESLEPDLPLINALMNAYNRANEPSVVLAIWDSLMATRQKVDGVTLSVFFDTCGRYGILERARMALASVRRMEADQRGYNATVTVNRQSRPYRQSAMNKGAWDSYLECLARCDRLEEAIELVFGEMRKSLLREALNANILADADNDSGETATGSLNNLLNRQAQGPVRSRSGHLIGPDAKTLGTLLRFAARERDRRLPRGLSSFFPSSHNENLATTKSGRGDSIWHDLRQRIREDYSWLYPSVQDVGDPSSPISPV